DVMAIKRQSPVLVPYRAAGEFSFNRGAAATLQWGRWEVTAFFSAKKFSGNLVTDSLVRFSSFGTSGYYRNSTEIADRYKITDVSAGGSVAYQHSSLKIGVNAVAHHFSLPLQKRDEPYNRFAPAGNDLLLLSADYGYTFRNVHIFGEAAMDPQRHHALVQGALVSLDPKMDLSLFYRNIQKEYQSSFGSAFTESTLPSNEEGLYAGLQVRPATRWQIATYADLYSFPFIKYRVSSPTRGRDYLVQVNYAPDKQTEMYLRIRSETKPLNEAGAGLAIQFPSDVVKQSLRVNLTAVLSRFLSVKGRTEVVWFRQNQRKETGVLVFVETGYTPRAQWRTNL
ncbi:MAG TPA: hypothetical protein VFL47_13580, partial [Flavisolibacter sp.]|nr:hypothetical protein [Flavisolibacter sp.]